MVKRFFLLIIVTLSSINAAQVGALRKAATSAALAGSAAGLAWMGSPYFGQREAQAKYAAALEQDKMHASIHGYLDEVAQPLLPAGKKVSFVYQPPSNLAHAGAVTFQVPGKNIIAFPADERSIWRMGPEEGDVPEMVRIGYGPDFPHNLAHELKHIIEDDSLRGNKRRENAQLGALGLSVLSLAGSAQNIIRPLPGRVAAWGLAASPFYYFSTKFNEAYKARQAEMIADNFAIQQATGERLQELYNKYKDAAVFSNKFAYTLELLRFNKGEISWDNFYSSLIHPTGKDRYNMVVTEMQKRGITPINVDHRIVPEIFSIQNATPEELQLFYDDNKEYAQLTNAQIYKSMWDVAKSSNKKEDWLRLYAARNELTGRDAYDMVVAEMSRRGIKPL